VNLEDTLAITQNFVNAQNVRIVWEDTKKDKKFHKTFNRDVVERYEHVRRALFPEKK
jgi:hypothetical protein